MTRHMNWPDRDARDRVLPDGGARGGRMRMAVVCAALVCQSHTVHSQQPPRVLQVGQVADLVRNNVTEARILSLIADGCVRDGDAELSQFLLRAGGASERVLRAASRFACQPLGPTAWRLRDIRFFEDSGESAWEHRTYGFRFSQADVRKVGTVLVLERDSAGPATTHKVTCRHGSEGPPDLLAIELSPEATSALSLASRVTRRDSTGRWAIGKTTVICSDDNDTIHRSFEVVRSSWRDVIVSPGVRVTGLAFGSPGAAPWGEKGHALGFVREPLKRVGAYLSLSYGAQQAAKELEVRCAWKHADWKASPVTEKRVSLDSQYVGTGMVTHIGDMGFDDPGRWPAGSITVDCFVGGIRLPPATLAIEASLDPGRSR